MKPTAPLQPSRRTARPAPATRPTSGLGQVDNDPNVSPDISGDVERYTYLDAVEAFNTILDETQRGGFAGLFPIVQDIMDQFVGGVKSLLSESGANPTIKEREYLECKDGTDRFIDHKVAVVDTQVTEKLIASSVETLKDNAKVKISDDYKEAILTICFDSIKTTKEYPDTEFIERNKFTPKPYVALFTSHPGIEWKNVTTEDSGGGGDNGGGTEPTKQQTCIEGVNSEAADAIETYLPPEAGLIGRKAGRYVLANVPVPFLADLQTYDGVVGLHPVGSEACGSPVVGDPNTGGGGNGGDGGDDGGDSDKGDSNDNGGGGGGGSGDKLIAGVSNSTTLLAGGGLVLTTILAGAIGGDDTPRRRYPR
jgi:hypothetical protein